MATINLEQLARGLEMSLPTARKLVREPDFPVVKDGGEGEAWEFDPSAVTHFMRARAERKVQEAREAEAAVEQMRLELVGGLTLNADLAGLTPKEQRDAIDAELKAGQLAKQRGELVEAATMYERLADAFTVLRNGIMAVPAKAATALNLDPAAEALIAEQLEAALKAAARRMSRMEPRAEAADVAALAA
jgi:phage terminase Nu1 subunit (DNA packaging protein)